MPEPDLERQKRLYWQELVELKVATIYMRRYRDNLGSWVTRISAVRAIASSGSIGAWAIWKELAFVWGFIIVISQVTDALKDVFPFVKTFKAASDHVTTLSSLLIESLLDWENISGNKYSDTEITTRTFKLMKLRLDAESKNFPDGLKVNDSLFAKAQEDAQAYFVATYKLEDETYDRAA
jgi:hypothetical protein